MSGEHGPRPDAASRPIHTLFGRGSWPEVRRIGDGLLLVGAAVLALVWANPPWREAYTALSEWTVGPPRAAWTCH